MSLIVAPFVAAAPASAAARAFSVRYSQNVEGGQIRVAGNSWITCSTTTGTEASSCTAAKSYQADGIVNSDNVSATKSRTMIPNDVDGVDSTTNSSSSTLTMPADAQVKWAGLYWANSKAVGPILLDTPATAGISYDTYTSSQDDNTKAIYSSFADVTAAVAAGGSGSYTAAPTTVVGAQSGWELMVVYGQPGGIDRQVVINDGLQYNPEGARTAITFGGFRTPPTGTVNADVATVMYDPDAGYTDSVTLGPDADHQTALPNPGPIDNDYANASVRNFNVKPTGAPDDANNFSVDAKVSAAAPNVIGNNVTSAVAAFDTRSSREYEYPAVIGLAIDNYVPNATLTKTVTDDNGGRVEPGDYLTYHLSAQSTGTDALAKTTLTDPLPAGVDYVPGSIRLGTGNTPVTDATGDDTGDYDTASRTVNVRLGQGADATDGGTLPARPDSPVQTASFRVQVPTTSTGKTIVNQAELTGQGSDTGTPVSVDASVPVTPVLRPAITLKKTATLDDTNHNGTADAGESISYGFTVTNSGNTRLTDVGVTDPTLGAVTCPVSVLEPAAATTCTASPRQVTQAEADAGTELTNTATAVGTAPDSSKVTDDDTARTPVTTPAPAITLVKSASPTKAAKVGQQVTFSFAVTNTGNTNLSDVKVDEGSFTGTGTLGALTCPASTLAPKADLTCTATYNNGLYGIYAFGTTNGVIENNYASGMADSGIYVGQCRPCRIAVRDNVAERNAVGYEGTNASSEMYVYRNRLTGNRVGLTTNSDHLEALLPQKGAQLVGNLVAANNTADSPEQADGGFGIGIGVAGGTGNTIARNLVTGNRATGLEITNNDDLAPTGNAATGNVFGANGTDVAYTAVAAAAGSGNCVSGGTVTTVVPKSFPRTCPAAAATITAAARPSVTVPPGVPFTDVPPPPTTLPDLAAAATAPHPVAHGPGTVDIAAVGVPTRELLVSQSSVPA